MDTHTLIAERVYRGELPPSAITSTGEFDYFSIAIAEEKRHTELGDAIATHELLEKILEN